jgi:hypothetical protein
MKTNTMKIGAALLAIGICAWSTQAFAQTTTTVTTTRGAFNEYVPGSETMVVRTDANAAPLRYVVNKQTTIVDESGAPVAIERISPGSQLAIQYTGSSDHLIASHIVVQRAATTAITTAPVTSGPATVTEQQTTTTTSRPLTHDEKHALKEEREHRKKAAKREIDREKDALDKEKDRLDDDDND